MNQVLRQSLRKINKALILTFLLLTGYYISQAQSLSVFDIDQSSFPTIHAKFYAFDKDGKQVTNLSPADFQVKEDGVERKVSFVSCPEPRPSKKVSLAMSIDVSGSMSYNYAGDIPVDLGKATAKLLVELLAIPPSEIALQICNDKALILQDFTKDKVRCLSALIPVAASGNNDFVEQLLNPKTGLLNIAKTGKYKKAAVIYTDAWWYGLTLNELQRCIDTCKKYDIMFYAVIYTRPEAEPNGIKSSLRVLCESTGGRFFDVATNLKAANDIASDIQQEVQEGEHCHLEWMSVAPCKENMVNAEVKWNVSADTTSYLISGVSLADLIIEPSVIYCRKKPVGIAFDTSITVKAINSDFVVSDIVSSNPAFDITPKNFTLAAGESRNLNLRYTPVDSSYQFATFYFENNLCQKPCYAFGGFLGKKPTKNPLRLIQPNGDEEFAIGTDTVITWEGVLPTDTVQLELSTDNGSIWRLITNKATGLKYIWKNIPKPASNKCLVRIATNAGDSDTIPQIEWQKCIGGTYGEGASSIIETTDGGFIVAGYTWSNDGDVSGSHGREDLWIAKLSQTGSLQWQKCLGGSYSDYAKSIIETVDGGFIVTGHVNSNDGDVSGNHGGDWDYWIVKLGPKGEFLWQKCLGGSYSDAAYSIAKTSDGGFIVGGSTYSIDGDVSGNHGSDDYWIVKLNQAGEIQWQKCLGGSFSDDAKSIIETSDGGFIVAGWTGSNNGDVSGFHGIVDCWIVKLNQTGDLQWQKCLGGLYEDEVASIIETSDGGFIVAGFTNSNDGDVAGFHGGVDYWIVKLSQNGNIQWQKCLGGSGTDRVQSIIETKDGGFIVAGYTDSNNGDVSGNHGNYDFWLVKLDKTGHLKWQKCLGGTSSDQASSIVETSDGGYIVCGFTTSNDEDVSGNHGFTDYWIVKLSPEGLSQSDVSDSVFSIVEPMATVRDIDLKQCLVGSAKDSLVTGFISNTGTYKCRIDSIYFTGADASAFSLVSGIPPYEIMPGSSHSVEFHFKPGRVGLHQAQIAIITQSDTLVQNIRGEGVQPLIAIANDFIDFGAVPIGESKDTLQALTIKNIGTNPVDIISTKHVFPNDKDFTTFKGAGPFTLQSGETAKMDLRFTPTEIGRTNGCLEFNFNGPGSPAVVRLFGQGLGGAVIISNDSAYAGEKRKLKLILGNNIKPKAESLITKFKTKLSYNKTMLTMTESGAVKSYDDYYETSEVTSGLDGSSPALGEFEVMAGLGNSDATDLIIDEFTWLNDKGEPVDFETETTNGTFTLQGVCREGGTRLVNPEGHEIIKDIYPNPSSGEIIISYELSEKSYSRIYINNIFGEKVKDVFSDDSPKMGEQSIKYNINDLSSGTYYIILETMNGCQGKRIQVVR